ncbi:hypothetical protein HOF92_15310, partial [bacterium]|nr:hypothetical protein [bacterium]
MEWNNLLGLGFFLWLPILVAIYFYRHRPQDQRVSSHFLWRKLQDRPNPVGFFENFLNHSLFWIQLCIFMLLFLAVSGPSLIDSSTGNELVLIIDNSGSMAARDGTGTMRRQSRLERALTVGREWVQKSSPRKMDVFTWSHDIHLSQSLDSGPFTLAIIAQSHFAGGDFASLLQFASARRKG